MALVLLVSADSRSGQTLREELASEGWLVNLVADREGALRAAADREPQVVVIDGRVTGAGGLIKIFSSRNGGPGAVALGLEGEKTDSAAATETEADEVLELEPSSERLIQAVERAAAIPHRSSAPASSDDDRLLTAAELFGDILSEVESGVGGGTSQGAGSASISGAERESPQEPSTSEEWPATSAADDQPADAADDARPEAAENGPRSSAQEISTSGESDAAEVRSVPAVDGPPAAMTSSEDSGSLGFEQPELDSRAEMSEQEAAASGAPAPSLSGALPGDAGIIEGPPGAESGDDASLSSFEEPREADTTKHMPDTSLLDDLPDESAFEVLDNDFEGSGDADVLPPSAIQPGDAEPDTWTPEEPLFGEPPELLPAIPGAGSVGEDVPAVDRDSSEQVPPSRPEAPGARGFAEGPSSAPAVQAVDAIDADFGQYRLDKRIAVGGMAEVWRASMVGLEGFEKTVAIKKILPHLAENDEFVAMFIDEAKLAARLNHENLVDIYDLGKIDDEFFIAMEYVDGWDLRSILNRLNRRGESFPLGLAFFIAAKVASALDYAHRRCDEKGEPLALVHRDVSPRNVLISHSGNIRLCDFGVAKAVSSVSQTQIGALKGKIQYMSPEQAQGQLVDGRSDLFSLGSVLFEMVTGRRVFEEDSDLSLLDAVRSCDVERPRSIRSDLPKDLERIIMRALSKRVDSRYQSAAEMLADLEQALFTLEPKPTQGVVAAWLQEVFSQAEESAAGSDPGERDVSGTTSAKDSGQRSPGHPVVAEESGDRPEKRGWRTWVSNDRFRFWIGVAAGLLLAALIALGVNAWLDRGAGAGVVEPKPAETGARSGIDGGGSVPRTGS